MRQSNVISLGSVSSPQSSRLLLVSSISELATPHSSKEFDLAVSTFRLSCPAATGSWQRPTPVRIRTRAKKNETQSVAHLVYNYQYNFICCLQCAVYLYICDMVERLNVFIRYCLIIYRDALVVMIIYICVECMGGWMLNCKYKPSGH